MKFIATLAFAAILGGGLLIPAGCESTNAPSGNDARHANTSESATYAPGTGVGSSSFDRHPRFYTGPNADQSAPPTTQPSVEGDHR
jgi:hypothetical protein